MGEVSTGCPSGGLCVFPGQLWVPPVFFHCVAKSFPPKTPHPPSREWKSYEKSTAFLTLFPAMVVWGLLT